MALSVKFRRYGEIDVLEVTDEAIPDPGSGEIVVRVEAAGINPGEASIRKGLLHDMWPASFPSGQGSDLAGIVEAVGDDVDGFSVGDEVLGFTDERASHAQYARVVPEHVVARPSGVPWEVAGSLHVVGTTAYAAVRAVGLGEGDVLVVSGAAGGVGSIVVQLAALKGATVIGLASERNHPWLAGHGAIPLTYAGVDVAARIRTAAGGSIDAFIDTFGDGYVDLALDLGVAPARIDTIIDFAAAATHGVKTEGNNDAATAEVMAELAGLISDGRLEVPIADVYPLVDVREAFAQLEQRHTHGKIVLRPWP